MQKKTKILATIGPASDSQEIIEKLIETGVNVFRLNFSHSTHEYHSKILSRIRDAIKNTGQIVGILQDISGPKVRVGELEEDFMLKTNDIVEFVKENIVGKKLSSNNYILTINQPSILEQIKLGDYIYMYDGIIRSKVIHIDDKSVKVEILNDGILSSKKGVNFPNTELGIDIITPKDKKDMQWGVENKVDFMAISFVQNAQDMIDARNIIKEYGGETKLIAKIEKFDAVKNIDTILEASDGLMVARGDLGIEIPYYDVPNVQKMLIKKANNAAKPVITATQMLLSMTKNDTATRAEISDIANAVLDGTDAVMLSEESAIGHNPALAVETMLKTIQGVETNYNYFQYNIFTCSDRSDNINEAAVRLSDTLNADGLLCITSSGESAKKIARYKPKCTVYAVTHSTQTAQHLTLSWGIEPTFNVSDESLGMMMSDLIEQGLKSKVLNLDSQYILTAGDPVGVSGTTNMIRIMSANEMEFFKSLKWNK